jgi:hypothetical protein
VLPAPLIGTLATVILPAAEGAAEILTTGVTRMSEEANPAVTAAYRAVLQIRTIAQNGVQRELILTNKPKGTVVLVPILAKRENFRDSYDKTTKFSVRILIGFSISSSYSLDAKASRGRARIFYAWAQKTARLIPITGLRLTSSPLSSFCPVAVTSLTLSQRATWKERNKVAESVIEERSQHLPFQVADRISRAHPGQISQATSNEIDASGKGSAWIQGGRRFRNCQSRF